MHKVSIQNFDEFLTEDSEKKFKLYREETIRWDGGVGVGQVNKIFIQPGLVLIKESFQFNQPVDALMELKSAPIEIFFCISGCLEGHSKELNREIKIHSGNTSFFFTPALKTDTTISANEPLKLITIRIHPEILSRYVHGLSEILPMIVNDIARLSSENCIISTLAMTPEMKMAVMQIQSCPFNNAFKKVFLESKTIELITLYFALLNDLKSKKSFSAPSFTSKEIKSIHDAKSILLENFENPPLLTQLAKQVGMNKDKLNQGFHKIFGTTVFNVYRHQKMEEAKNMLESKEMNVTEVAYNVGYSQPGTFSRAFKQYYGISPKDYSRRMATEY